MLKISMQDVYHFMCYLKLQRWQLMRKKVPQSDLQPHQDEGTIALIIHIYSR